MVIETAIVSQLTGELTPSLMSEIQMPSMIAILISSVIFAVLVLGIFSFFSWMGKCINPKSLQYRKLLVDMYIVGMVKKFAKEDDIDLVQELKDFNKIQRKKDLRDKDIDSVIEANLKDKIDAKSEKEIDKIETGF